MKSASKLFLAAALTAAISASSDPGLARGGAASIMNSPGYQRRLQESRQPMPAAVQPSPHRRKTRPRH